MKKIFAVMLALALLLSLAAVAEAADFLGVWYLSEVREDGQSYSPADFGMSMSIELLEDGSAVGKSAMGADAQELSGTWTQDGDTITVIIDDEAMAFTIEDGTLVSGGDGAQMVFGREAVEVEIYTPAAPVTAEEADFAGTWTAIKYGFDGTFYNADVMGVDDMTAEFTDDGLLLTGMFGSDEPFPVTFADGMYSFETDDENQMFSSIKAQKLEDGNLMLTMEISGEMVLIMAPAAAAE